MGDLLVLLKHSVLIVLVAAVYSLPSIIARVNGLRSSIYLINLLLGWTVLGVVYRSQPGAQRDIRKVMSSVCGIRR